MTVSIKRQESRLKHAQLYTSGGVEFWGRPELPDLPVSPNDTTHVIKEGERIETVARYYYRNAGLWWVIAYRNGMHLLPSEFRVGLRITIPDPEEVRKKLFV